MFKKQVTYQAFCKAERPKIVASNPQLGFGEIVKMLGVAWSRLSVADKLAYGGPGFRGRGAAAATAAPPPPPALPVAEAEGLRLHLSSSNNTGYKGVYQSTSNIFVAKRAASGRQVSLGQFGTAVEAAVAYAQAVGEYQPPASPTLSSRLPEAAPQADPVAEAEGLRLHLSIRGKRNPTGYKGVRRVYSGAFEAKRCLPGRGKGKPSRQVSLGHFGSAVEAAVAYARAVGEAAVATTAEVPTAVAATAEEAPPMPQKDEVCTAWLDLISAAESARAAARAAARRAGGRGERAGGEEGGEGRLPSAAVEPRRRQPGGSRRSCSAAAV